MDTMSYKESEKHINDIRQNDEMLFRLAVSHLMDVGIRHLTDENVDATCKGIRHRITCSWVLQENKHCILKTILIAEEFRIGIKPILVVL